ncbi:hypothetical protein LCGC14_1544900 [marine sediment metagenome]|uniref:Uncharacterized protein n=1 Tax=marine sediment metagenome TaxID=412755 RepID=A0A0F9JCT6_9ZZZZ
MEIIVRYVTPYKDVKIKHDRTEIDLGLFKDEELIELIMIFKDAADELES